jgi:putative transposase
MPSTHTSLHYHLVWSTKDRRNTIDSQWRERLHAWLGGNIRAQNGVALIVGGVADHVHALIGLRATHCLADVVRILKSESSEWIHNELRIPTFEWQEGYGAFTVSPTQLDVVRHYIANQEEHHRAKTFQEEYVELLQRAEIQYDAKYLW